ncbi:MAG: ABATE domain-containing protein [Gemmatimonadota bacterium]|nr:MAG: ABATE domain-containing protein [Gemmatimonadota bacterium]
MEERDSASTRGAPRFELSGGRLSLDFANTVDNRPTEGRKELLNSYSDLIAWAEQAGVIEAEEARVLGEEGMSRPADADAALAAARDLREALFAIFSSIASGRGLPERSIAALNAALPAAMSALRLAAVDGGFEWRWAPDRRGLDRMLAPLIRDAAELLTSPDLSRVRLCESETCGWLFLDQSRNRTRRWCDMSVCGNRAKARRHYQRKKRKSKTGGGLP